MSKHNGRVGCPESTRERFGGQELLNSDWMSREGLGVRLGDHGSMR
jgi:hypothetical protein